MLKSEQEARRSELLQDLSLEPQHRNGPSSGRGKAVLFLAAVAAMMLGYGLYLQVDEPHNSVGESTSSASSYVSLVSANNAVAESATSEKELQIRMSGEAAPALEAVLDASGYVVARRKATVSAKITGKVERILVNEGDSVSEGQLLATLDSSLLQSLRSLKVSKLREREASLAEMSVQLEEAQQLLQRMTELHTQELISVAQFDNANIAYRKIMAGMQRVKVEIESAQNELNIAELQLLETQIRAPFDGVVVSRSAQAGEIVSPMSAGGGFTRTGICSLVDMNSLELEVEVNESNIQLIHRGQKVVARLNSYPDWAIPAEVVTLIPTADRTKATIKLRIRLMESDTRILPQMGVRVAFY